MPLTPLQAVQQLQDDVALFAAVMHGTSGDTVDLGDSVVVPTLAGVMAILASNADSVISMEKILASAGQVAGVDDNTEAFAEALSLLGPGKCLMLGSTNYKISDTLALPDNSGWSIMSPGLATVTQTTDNKPIWRMTPTTYRSRFKMRGIAHNWTNDQPSTNTDAIGIAFHVDEDIQNGIYDFELSDLVFDNGFRGIAPDASTISNGYVLPIWGWQIERVTSYTGVKGATIFLGAFGNCGAPRGKLQNFYAQSLNAVEPALILQGMELNRSRRAGVQFRYQQTALFKYVSERAHQQDTLRAMSSDREQFRINLHRRYECIGRDRWSSCDLPHDQHFGPCLLRQRLPIARSRERFQYKTIDGDLGRSGCIFSPQRRNYRTLRSTFHRRHQRWIFTLQHHRRSQRSGGKF